MGNEMINVKEYIKRSNLSYHYVRNLLPTKNKWLSISVHEGIELVFLGNPFNLEPCDVVKKIYEI